MSSPLFQSYRFILADRVLSPSLDFLNYSFLKCSFFLWLRLGRSFAKYASLFPHNDEFVLEDIDLLRLLLQLLAQLLVDGLLPLRF